MVAKQTERQLPRATILLETLLPVVINEASAESQKNRDGKYLIPLSLEVVVAATATVSILFYLVFSYFAGRQASGSVPGPST